MPHKQVRVWPHSKGTLQGRHREDSHSQKREAWGISGSQNKNHSTQDSRVVPHRGTNWAALWLTAQIGRDAVLSESYGRGYQSIWWPGFDPSKIWSASAFQYKLSSQIRKRSDIQRKVINALIVFYPHLLLSAPIFLLQKNRRPTKLCDVQIGFNITKGDYKHLVLRELLRHRRTLEWKLRMNGVFHPL